MCNKGIHRAAVIDNMLDKTLDVEEHIILKPIILLLCMFACFNLLVPAQIIADETDFASFGLYKNGVLIDSFPNIIAPSISNSQNHKTANLTPMAQRYLETVKKKDDYYKSEDVVFARLLESCKNLINKINSGQLGFDSPEAEMLNKRISKIIDAHTRLLAKISQTETELKESNLPADIIQKYNTGMAKSKAKTAELIELLKTCQYSLEHKDNTVFNNTMTALVEYFNEAETERKKYPEVLPITSPEPQVLEFKKAPRMQGDSPLPAKPVPDTSGSVILDEDPTPDDLASTIDVQFTPEIEALAEELNHSPVEIYQYVRNNFDFEVYIGSRKGSQQTLEHKRGNDYDLASLLIALLRVSEIPARYCTDSVLIPNDRFCNWLGIDDVDKAAGLLYNAGFQVVQYESAVQLNLVSVRAYLPIINYRGAINDANSKGWILLNPTFKQYQYSSSINLLSELNEPTHIFDAGGFIADYYDTVREETPLEWFQQALEDSLAIYHPGTPFKALIRTKTIIKETDEILPGTLPYTVIDYGEPFAVIPDNMRYKITVTVKDQWGVYSYLTYTTSVPERAHVNSCVNSFFKQRPFRVSFFPP